MIVIASSNYFSFQSFLWSCRCEQFYLTVWYMSMQLHCSCRRGDEYTFLIEKLSEKRRQSRWESIIATRCVLSQYLIYAHATWISVTSPQCGDEQIKDGWFEERESSLNSSDLLVHVHKHTLLFCGQSQKSERLHTIRSPSFQHSYAIIPCSTCKNVRR